MKRDCVSGKKGLEKGRRGREGRKRGKKIKFRLKSKQGKIAC